MRSLIILSLAALVLAAPEGYHYPKVQEETTNEVQDNAKTQWKQEPIVNKRFYTYSAPEDDEPEVIYRDIVLGAPRKSYNVVFIKAPVAKQQKAKIRIIPAANEDKTYIYLLAKKTDAPVLESHVEEPVTTTAKPEVFFIKYRTNKEAEHVQHHIQAKYDNLGGNTQVSNEGVSRVTSVIGSLDESPKNTYLPPVKH
ncbi:uncharacterized protein LOC133321651 [Musca vetustissima]|uniref:uncharacterized protein LOC133321651 n=1 Tax=Musca vetustissima TaxID=27455 RepID=UPI002AB78BA1|nr:uncharacterized protein LOC133321651 [Musca vetustissima]